MNDFKKFMDKIHCESTFNGFGIYKYDVFKDIRYNTHIDLELFDVNKLKKNTKIIIYK